MENQRLVSSSWQCSSTPVGFGQGFLRKERCTNTAASRHTLMTWIQLIFTCSLHWNQYWRDGAFVMLLTPLRMRQESWKGCHKMASRNVFNTFTVAARSVYLHKWTNLKEMQLELLHCFVFHRKRVMSGNILNYHVYLAQLQQNSIYLD